MPKIKIRDNEEFYCRNILYLSDYLEKHRNSYYTSMMRVRTENDINGWFKFFLTGVIETAKDGISTFEEILRLQKENEELAKSLGSKSANVMKVLTELYKNPIMNVSTVAAVAGTSTASAYSLVAAMESCGILSEVTGGKKHRVYVFKKYLDIFNK